MPPLTWKYGLGFLAALLLMAVLFHYPVIVDHPPYGHHQWRQSDCWAITQNFYHEDRSLLEPRMNYMGHGEEDGFAEFPIIYYTDARLMELFGKSIAIPRATNILILLTGLFFLFLTIRRVLKSEFWGGFLPLLCFSSPLLIYYGGSPMLNVPALSFLFFAFYTAHRYYRTGLDRFLLGTAIFIALAGVMRATMVLGASALYILFLGELFSKKGLAPGDKRLFPDPIKQGGILLIPVLLVGGWVAYAKAWNSAEGHAYFLMGPSSFFTMNWKDTWMVATRLYQEFLHETYTRPFLFLLLLLFTVFLVRWNSFSRTARVILVTYAGMSILYGLGWYRNLYQHDYYLIDTFPMALALIVVFIHFVKELAPAFLHSRMVRIPALLLLLMGIYNGSVLQGKRFNIGGSLVNQTFIVSNAEEEYWDWFHNAQKPVRSLYGITPYLRSLGIERTDPVISLPDPSPNHTLALMDQHGFTQLYRKGKEGKELLRMWMKQGAEYLVVNDPSYLKNHDLSSCIDRQIGSYQGVRIYRLVDREKS
ncbi:MAG: hypothetical protein ABEH38_03505 [Flavobacteriales bacterium]